MPPRKIELPYPVRGRSDVVGKAKQQPLTSAEESDVRGLDPVTGRIRGAQRSGTVQQVTPAQAARIDMLASVGYQVDLTTYTAQSGILGVGAIETNVLTPSQGAVFSLRVGRQGDIYAIDGNDRVVIYSSELVKSGEIAVPLGGKGTLARTLALDEEDRIYVGAVSEGGPTEGTVWRFSRTESGDTKRWKQDWELPLDRAVKALDYRFGALAVAQETRDEDTDQAFVSLYDVVSSTEPIELWSVAAPYPVGDVHVGKFSGDVFYTSPYNEDRAGTDGYGPVTETQSIEAFLPNADERLFLHLDPRTLDGFQTGDLIYRFPDARLTEPLWSDEFGSALIDNTDRGLFWKKGQGWFAPPTFDANAFGNLPGIRFNGSQVLASGANKTPTNKTDETADKLPKSRSVIPGVSGAKWAMVMLCRIERSDDPSPIFGIKGDGNIYGLLANAQDDVDPTAADLGPPAAATPGLIRFFTFPDPAAGGGGAGLEVDVGSWSNDEDLVLISIVHNIGSVNTSEFRVNGVTVDNFTMASGDEAVWAEGGAVALFGYPFRKKDGAISQDPFGKVSGLSGFRGVIGPMVVWLGATTTTPHDTDIPIAGEVAEVEGIIAHAYGVQTQCLLGGHTYVSAPPVGSFAGSSQTATQQAMQSRKAVTVKYRASSGEAVWAFDAPGQGVAITTDETDGVYVYGQMETNLGGIGPQSPILRKILDNGESYEAGTPASGTLTFGTAVPGAGEQVVIGGLTYTFVAVPGAAYDVDIAATVAGCIENLAKAIELAGTPGATTYHADTLRHPEVYVTSYSATTLVVESVVRGSDGDSIVTTTDVGGASWGAATLAGGNALGTWADIDIVAGEHEGVTTIFPFGNTNVSRLEAFDGQLWVCRSTATVSVARGAYRYPTVSLTTDGLNVFDARWSGGYTGAPSSEPYISLVLPEKTDYGTQDIDGPEFLYVSTEGPGGPTAAITTTNTTKNLHKVRIVTAADSGADSPRARKYLAVSGGNLLSFTDTWSTVSASLFGAGAVVQATALFGKLYMTDGVVNKVYDPVLGTVVDWKAEGLGKVPERIKLLTSWRGRAVVVPTDKPSNWVMSKLGDPLDWDEYPDVPTFEQAVSGNNPRSIGKFPDLCNALIPYDDDTLVIGGDSTIHVLMGDPAVITLDGTIKANLSLVSDVVGMAHGQQGWTKDREGILYFVGNSGGVYRMAGRSVERISYGSVERALSDFDWSIYRPALAWNKRDEGLHLFLLPYGTQATPAQAWFWEQKTDGWHPDSFPFQPTAVAVIDGDDPDDRHLLIGTDDGRVLRWDGTAASDDGTRIQSSVLFGPFDIGSTGYEGKISELEVTLDESQQGCDWELYASSTPTRPADPVESGRLRPGINIIRAHARGKWLWLRLRNGTVNERWAHESTAVQADRGGRVQVRV